MNIFILNGIHIIKDMVRKMMRTSGTGHSLLVSHWHRNEVHIIKHITIMSCDTQQCNFKMTRQDCLHMPYSSSPVSTELYHTLPTGALRGSMIVIWNSYLILLWIRLLRWEVWRFKWNSKLRQSTISEGIFFFIWVTMMKKKKFTLQGASAIAYVSLYFFTFLSKGI